jgi:hypothetical protein
MKKAIFNAGKSIIKYIGKIGEYKAAIIGAVVGLLAGYHMTKPSADVAGPHNARPARAIPGDVDFNGDGINDIVIRGRDGYHTILYGTKEGVFVSGSELNEDAKVPIAYDTIEARLNTNLGE